MGRETDAQRDAKRISAALEKLFAWASTKSSPMPPSDLLVIREQITGDIERLVSRTDVLELAPLLREVTVNPDDGVRTVTVDMRDGTTRSFQTMVDWFDTSTTAVQEFDEQALMEAKEMAQENLGKISEANERTAVATQKAEEFEKRALIAEDLLARERDARDDDAERHAEQVEAQRLEAEATSLEVITALRTDRDKLRAGYMSASKVIDESLPALAEVLGERTDQLKETRFALKRLCEEVEQAESVGICLPDRTASLLALEILSNGID